MADDHHLIRPLREYFMPNTYTPASCITRPDVGASHFEIKASVIQMLPLFYGLSNEDPYRHLDEFLEICSTVRINNFGDGAMRLTLFLFSLKDKAKHWLKSLETVRITTWEGMQREFLKKYFPIGKMNQFRKAITNFSQIEGEQFHESWERLKDLLRKCPHHQVPRWQLVQYFYDGLTKKHRQMVDSSCGGTFMIKSEDKAWSLFETLSENTMHHTLSSRLDRTTSLSSGPRKIGISEVGSELELRTKVDQLTRKLDQLLANSLRSPAERVCELCASPAHCVSDCPTAPLYPEFLQEQVNAAQGFAKPMSDSFTPSYNSGWRNQSIPSSHQPSRTQYRQSNPSQGYSHPIFPQVQYSLPSLQEPIPSLSFQEKMLEAFYDIKATLCSHTQSIAKLETQMGQLAQTLNRQSQGTFIVSLLSNPREMIPCHLTCKPLLHIMSRLNLLYPFSMGRSVTSFRNRFMSPISFLLTSRSPLYLSRRGKALSCYSLNIEPHSLSL